MFSSRTNERIKVMIVLYNEEFGDSSLLEEFKSLNEYGLALYNNIKLNLNKIDDIIIKNLIDYSINRLNLVDKQIIRIATYELLCNDPKEVIINEALNISKIYSETEKFKSSKFNNKLLDNIAKYIGDLNE